LEKIAQLTREYEANLPEFNSHDEARSYFKNKFGDSFVMMDSNVIGGEKHYRYYLILDPEAFNKMQQELRENGHYADPDLSGLMSYQTIEIAETGEIHILY
jgi:hypothetical protein